MPVTYTRANSDSLFAPPSGWFPSGPSSYSATGTVTLSTALDNSAAGIYAVFNPSWQHVVANSHGIFALYQQTDNGNHDPSSWRLKRSTNGGASWSLIRDSSTAGDPQYGSPPLVETDQNENVYVLANYLPQAGESFRGVKMYKWTNADNYATPTITTLDTNGRASGKWTSFLDQSRQWIWICMWADAASPNLFAYNYSGALQYSRQVFKPLVRRWTPTLDGANDKHGEPHYPSLHVGTDGTVYLAWNSEAFQAGDFTGASLSYYDVRMVYSTSSAAQFQAGTETWQGPNSGQTGAPSARTLPLSGDDAGLQSETAYQIVKTSNTTDEFMPASNANYGVNTGQSFNFNRLYSIAVNSGYVHFYYESETSVTQAIKHHSYARFRMSSHDLADSDRRTPEFHYDTTNPGDRLGPIGGAGGGSFIQDTTQANRLYFVQSTSRNLDETFRVLRSDDGGFSWFLYATSPVVSGAGPSGLLGVQAHRWVQSDGSIIGIFALADSPYTVYTFKVTPN